LAASYDRADERHGLNWAFLEGYVAQLVDQAECVPPHLRIVATRGQYDEREIRPRRLIAYTAEEGDGVGAEKGFLGDHGRTGATLKLPL
jgi:hypothetical protein